MRKSLRRKLNCNEKLDKKVTKLDKRLTKIEEGRKFNELVNNKKYKIANITWIILIINFIVALSKIEELSIFILFVNIFIAFINNSLSNLNIGYIKFLETKSAKKFIHQMMIIIPIFFILLSVCSYYISNVIFILTLDFCLMTYLFAWIDYFLYKSLIKEFYRSL